MLDAMAASLMFHPLLLARILCSRMAVRITLASWPCSAVNCSPSGSASATGIGTEIAGVPNAVHGEFILELPVNAKPSGAGPGAAGTSMTGVVL